MNRVSTTAFFMPAWTSPRLDRLAAWGRLLLLCWACLWCATASRAQDSSAEVAVAVQRSTDGLFITARLPLELGPAVEEALFKAVPVYFVYQADVYEPRWYWTDKRIASATRTLRLAYQPLTRRWRLSAANGPGGANNQQYALHQNFESLSEAVAALGRLARWRIADANRLEEGERYSVAFRFRLDLSLLPRPFQIGMANQPDWNIDVLRQLRTTASAEGGDAPAPVPVPAEQGVDALR
jgi:hypothetical protein